MRAGGNFLLKGGYFFFGATFLAGAFLAADFLTNGTNAGFLPAAFFAATFFAGTDFFAADFLATGRFINAIYLPFTILSNRCLRTIPFAGLMPCFFL